MPANLDNPSSIPEQAQPQQFDPSPSHSDTCPFCTISQTYPPLDPSTLATSPPSSPSPFNPDLLSPNAHLILSTPHILAFLDILPLSPGHLLVITRSHATKISDVTAHEARELGYWLSVLSRVLARVQGVWDWNIVQNNGAAAAQVVPHVHYHVIPRPGLEGGERNRSFTMFGRGQRSEIDDEEAKELCERLRRELGREVRGVEEGEGRSGAKL